MVTAAIPGEATFFWKAVEVVKDFKPITAAETERLKSLASGNPPIFDHPLA
jgi:hypothetical protein